jgi:hypothetical protein
VPAARNRKHILVHGAPISEHYRPHLQVNNQRIPAPADRQAHGMTLRKALEDAG